MERGPEGIKTEFNGFYSKGFLREINNQDCRILLFMVRLDLSFMEYTFTIRVILDSQEKIQISINGAGLSFCIMQLIGDRT